MTLQNAFPNKYFARNVESAARQLRGYRGPKAETNKVGYHDAGIIDIGGFLNNFKTGNYGKQFKF